MTCRRRRTPNISDPPRRLISSRRGRAWRRDAPGESHEAEAVGYTRMPSRQVRAVRAFSRVKTHFPLNTHRTQHQRRNEMRYLLALPPTHDNPPRADEVIRKAPCARCTSLLRIVPSLVEARTKKKRSIDYDEQQIRAAPAQRSQSQESIRRKAGGGPDNPHQRPKSH